MGKLINEEELKKRLAEEAEKESGNSNGFNVLQNIIAQGNAQKNASQFTTNPQVNNWLGFNMATASPLQKALLEPETYPSGDGRSHGGSGAQIGEQTNPLKGITFDDLKNIVAEGNGVATADSETTAKDQNAFENNPSFNNWLGFDMRTASPLRKTLLDSETYPTESEPSESNGSDIYPGVNERTDTTVSNEALNYVKGQLESLNSQRTQYSDKIDALINDYLNRGRFEYDPNADMLYQNYLAAMQNAGQMAMKDTMGQAAMLTGGYGSSYATSAANGAYNSYLQKANEALPEYYNIAANAYDRQGEEMLAQMKLLQSQDEEAYKRYAEQMKLATGGSASANGSEDTWTASQENKVRQEALSTFREKGKNALFEYIDSLSGYNLSDETLDGILKYVEQYGKNDWTMTKDAIGTTRNEYTDSQGTTKTYSELEQEYKRGKISEEDWKLIQALTRKGQTTKDRR